MHLDTSSSAEWFLNEVASGRDGTIVFENVTEVWTLWGLYRITSASKSQIASLLQPLVPPMPLVPDRYTDLYNDYQALFEGQIEGE